MSLTEIDRCPCCGQVVVEEYEICPVCKWQNDPVQLAHPDTSRGANYMTLNEARAAYARGEVVE